MDAISPQNIIEPRIEPGWKNKLEEEFKAAYFLKLKSFLISEKKAGKTIYPPGPLIFNAFDKTPFDQVKVVILGQDPYHGTGQAHGLCFSVNQGITPPPSLKNIFKELNQDLNILPPSSGNLEKWAVQGVLLLNATLTVRAGEAGSHQNQGWEQFTDSVIRLLSNERDGLIFLLWGRYAHAKEILIDAGKHHILKAAHPSPFSAYQGFMGCRHFSKVNEILNQQGREPIDWNLNS